MTSPYLRLITVVEMFRTLKIAIVSSSPYAKRNMQNKSIDQNLFLHILGLQHWSRFIPQRGDSYEAHLTSSH